MEDREIIYLYNHRDERAIRESHKKYGGMLHRIALNILSNQWDSEEIVNDTYNKSWEAIPPDQPQYLGAYLGRISRNLSINMWKKQRAQKRYDGGDILLSELGECIPGNLGVESTVEFKELVDTINKWLGTLDQDQRILFIRRYWFADNVKSLAKETGTSANKMAGRLYRLRQSLKEKLEKEGIYL